MKKSIFLLLLVIILVGCGEKEKIKINFTCNGIKKEYKVGIDSKLKCTLFASEYEIKIIALDENKFTIQSNKPLSAIDNRGHIDSNSTELFFDIMKGQKTKLALPLDGLLYTIEFEW